MSLFTYTVSNTLTCSQIRRKVSKHKIVDYKYIHVGIHNFIQKQRDSALSPLKILEERGGLMSGKCKDSLARTACVLFLFVVVAVGSMSIVIGLISGYTFHEVWGEWNRPTAYRCEAYTVAQQEYEWFSESDRFLEKHRTTIRMYAMWSEDFIEKYGPKNNPELLWDDVKIAFDIRAALADYVEAYNRKAIQYNARALETNGCLFLKTGLPQSVELTH